MKRKGDWLQTYTGKQFWPLDARPEEVCIADIAHALSQLCRFGGHCRAFYSVAQHSVSVALRLSPALQAEGLMHDATEAYLVDVPRPIKYHLGGYTTVETALARVIGERFGLPLANLHPEVHIADNRMLITEQRDLMAKPPCAWDNTAEPYLDYVHPISPEQAERSFLFWADQWGIR